MNDLIQILRSAIKWITDNTWPTGPAQTIVEWMTAEAELLPKYDLSPIADVTGTTWAVLRNRDRGDEEDGDDGDHYDWEIFQRLESVLINDLDFRYRLGQMISGADEEYGEMKATEEDGEESEKVKASGEEMDITDMVGMMMEEVEVEEMDATSGDIGGEPRKLL